MSAPNCANRDELIAMGYFRFRRSFRLFPGRRVNLHKSGVSTSIGCRS
jgi:hypothetical protein